MIVSNRNLFVLNIFTLENVTCDLFFRLIPHLCKTIQSLRSSALLSGLVLTTGVVSPKKVWKKKRKTLKKTPQIMVFALIAVALLRLKGFRSNCRMMRRCRPEKYPSL